MSLERYQEATALGLNKREAGLVALAEDIARVAQQWREENERFASDIGSSMAELRALPFEDRPYLQDLYAAWLCNH